MKGDIRDQNYVLTVAVRTTEDNYNDFVDNVEKLLYTHQASNWVIDPFGDEHQLDFYKEMLEQ